MRLLPSASLLAGLALATLASPALAGGPASSASARADALFARGKAEMAAGHVATACAALAESLALEPAEGTLLALGLCREKEGELVTAHGLLRDVATRTDRDERRRVAKAAIARIEDRLGRVVVNVPSPAPPGAVAAVDVAEPEPRAATAEVAVTSRAPTVVGSVAPAAPERPAEGKSTPWLGWSVAGAGVVALGAGAFFGARAASGWEGVEAKCDPSACKDASALADARNARADARIANVAVISGAVLVGAGILLVLTHGSGRPRTSKVTAALLGGGRVAF